MKHHLITWLSVLLIAAILAGCGAADPTVPQTDIPVSTGTSIDEPVENPDETITDDMDETSPEGTEENIVSGEDVPSDYVDAVYAEQIGRFYTALSEQWEENEYLDNDLSTLPFHYADGDPLENVGFGNQDLDNDGSAELIIGAISNAQQDPVVFEIWTLVDGEPVMLAQSGYKNYYYLQFAEEDNAWYVSNVAVSSAANNATYSLMLMEGKFEVMQGIVFDAHADETNPWFMTYDLDWDVSNDEPIDEEMANAILENNRRIYTSQEYFPYSLYR